MLGYLVKRLIATIPAVILLVAVCVFGFVHMLPGDPARLIAGMDASPETVLAVRKSLGLDQPWPGSSSTMSAACCMAISAR